jgi:hypothetical protein
MRRSGVVSEIREFNQKKMMNSEIGYYLHTAETNSSS